MIARLHDTAPDCGLPPLHRWLAARLTTAPADVPTSSVAPSGQQRADALTTLVDLPDAATFCHGDLNPSNVLATVDGEIVPPDARGAAGT